MPYVPDMSTRQWMGEFDYEPEYHCDVCGTDEEPVLERGEHYGAYVCPGCGETISIWQEEREPDHYDDMLTFFEACQDSDEAHSQQAKRAA